MQHNNSSTIQNCLLMIIVAGAWFADKIDSYTALGVLLFIGGLVAVPTLLNKKLPPDATPLALGSIGVASMLTKFFPHVAVFLIVSSLVVGCGAVGDSMPAVGSTLLAVEHAYHALCAGARELEPACVEAKRAINVAVDQYTFVNNQLGDDADAGL